MVVAIKFGFRSSLRRGKVLAFLTSVVLKGTLLVKFAIECYLMLIDFFEE